LRPGEQDEIDFHQANAENRPDSGSAARHRNVMPTAVLLRSVSPARVPARRVIF
jgi:hypothetical protein